VDRMLTTKIWKFITPPWEKDPQSAAPLVHHIKANGAKTEESKGWRKPAATADEPM